MVTVFTVCAVVGSVIVVIQFLMLLVGMGHDFGGDLHLDLDHGDVGAGGHELGEEGAHFFGLLSFRAIVAALAVFGLAGLAANQGGFGSAATLLVALLSGAVALVAVAWAMKFLYSLRDDGTVHIERSVGQHGTVYLPIPGERGGTGKVFLNLQNRTVECQAITSKGALPSGAQVVVVGFLGANMVEVELCSETERETALHV